MPHPPYSPDLAPSDFFVCLFPWMKNVLKGICFTDVEEVKQKMAEALKGIKIKEFKNFLEQREKGSIGVLHQMESTLKVIEV